jgi:hypothetical protein
MPLAIVDRMAIPQPVGAEFAAIAAPAMLAIPYVEQSESMWCWAACGEMLFTLAGISDKTQCVLASSTFGLTCCPSPGAPPACDQGAWPHLVYPPQGLPTNLIQAPLSSPSIAQQLAAGKAVQVCYQWTQGGKHVALIVGDYGNDEFEVFDPIPIYGRGRRALSDISSGYGLGIWLCSFTF